MNKHNFRRWLARLTAIGMVAAGVVSCGGSDDPVVQPATLVLRGGKVMTMDAGGTIASAVAVRGRRIVAVGSDAAMAGYINDETKIVELDGRMLLPGFIDAHIHPVLGSERMNECSAGGETLKVDVIVQIALDCVAADPAPRDDKWIQVVNVNPATFVATADDLDAISTVRPVILIGIDGHTSWVNHKALALAGITAATPDPVGGQIERDAHGNPTGFLKDAAQGLVTALIPPLSFSERKALAQQAIELIRSKGITAVQDAWASEDAMDIYEALAQDGTLKMRVRATLASDVVDDEAEYKRLIALRARFANHDLIRANGVKIFSDGVIEYPTQTAAMIVPYYDGHGGATTNYGGRYFEQSVLNAYVARLDAEGFTVHTHSIGDYTTHAVLDALAYARGKNGVTDNRHQISHLQVVDPADFPRFAALGVAANMQLFWALPDVYTIDAVQPYMRPDRFELMYPAGSLLAAGAELVGGSDWPVDVFPDDPMPNTPLSASAIALTRVNEFEPQYAGLVLNAKERVTLKDMLAAYTINAARALRLDTEVGSIEVGKLADFVVLDQDITAITPMELLAVQVHYTIFDGEVVYDNTAAPMAAPAALRSVALEQPASVKRTRAARRSHDFCGDATHRHQVATAPSARPVGQTLASAGGR
ncbi:MAG: amidohydrolase family protein [Burkholderiaceae bacterium]|nr:amidohydrolase family protein [Burkholderiaceae bacterium]